MNSQNNNYISFPNVYDTNNQDRKTNMSSKSLILEANHEKPNELIRHDLINVYSSKKFAKWFSIDETKTHENGNYTIYKIAYRVSFFVLFLHLTITY
jgi:hypothetical protein